MDSYKTVRTSGQGEYVEKKSRFIGAVYHAETLEEAESYLAAARKKYYDARHNCFACVVGTPGTPEEIVRSNDDGEPGGTAGKPMLEVLSMARAQHPDSAGSQFFIMHKDAPYLDGQYAAFGKITEGIDVVDKIASQRTNFADKPLKPQIISSMTVDTQGVDYPEPKKA